MKVMLNFPYGKMAAGLPYEVSEVGRDYYLFRNGYYVYKNFCSENYTIKKESKNDFEFDYDDYFDKD